jgi:anti-anti-sigma factor
MGDNPGSSCPEAAKRLRRFRTKAEALTVWPLLWRGIWEALSGFIPSKSAILLASASCYHGILTYYALTGSSGGQSAFPREKGRSTMDRAHDGGRRLELVGEYDIADKATLANLFGALAPDGPAEIDMTKVTYIDSTFLHQIERLRSRLKEHRVTLFGVDKNVRRVLHAVNFDHLFQIIEA